MVLVGLDVFEGFRAVLAAVLTALSLFVVWNRGIFLLAVLEVVWLWRSDLRAVGCQQLLFRLGIWLLDCHLRQRRRICAVLKNFAEILLRLLAFVFEFKADLQLVVAGLAEVFRQNSVVVYGTIDIQAIFDDIAN